jgi:hypothetical protein
LALQIDKPASSGLLAVTGLILSGITLRMPRGAVGAVAAARAATHDLKVLQIGEIDDHAKGKGYSAPDQYAFKYVVYPLHSVRLIRDSSKALNYLNTS